MSLVERYVEAVRKQLPRAERDDIAAELRETLRSEIEEAEAGRGGPLTDDDVAEILRRYGAPEVVAARYGAPTHLIGPAVYPHYKAVVKIALWILGGLLTFWIAVTAITEGDPLPAIAWVMATGAVIVLFNLTVLTLIFARLERARGFVDWAQPWDPRGLEPAPAPRTAISRWETVGGLVMAVFWLLWWIDVLPINKWFLWSRLPLGPAPIWDALTPLIVGLMLATITVNTVLILRPRLTRLHDAAALLFNIGFGVMLTRAIRAGEFIVVKNAASPAAGLAALLNGLILLGLMAWALLVIVSIISAVWKWVAPSRRREAVSL